MGNTVEMAGGDINLFLHQNQIKLCKIKHWAVGQCVWSLENTSI